MWPSCRARTKGLGSTEADPPRKTWTSTSCLCTNCTQQDSKPFQLTKSGNCSPVYVTNWWCWLESSAAEWCVACCACGLSWTWFINCKRCNEPVLAGLTRLSLQPLQENGWTDPRIDSNTPPKKAFQVSTCSTCFPLPLKKRIFVSKERRSMDKRSRNLKEWRFSELFKLQKQF